MKIVYDDKRIYIKKLFNWREIPYSDIRSVVLVNMVYTITTNEGEVISSKKRLFGDYTALYKAFREYNIYFKNEDELKETNSVYSINEVNEMIAKTQSVVEEYAGNLIHEKVGAEYDIAVKTIDEDEYINLYLFLLKNGVIVKDIPKGAKYESADIEPYSFDNFVLAFLLEWNSCGRYGVTKEVEKRETCEMYLTQSLNFLFEHYEKS